VGGGQGKKRILSDEEDESMLYPYENSIMRPTKRCLKEGKEGERK
jgi:hypothetical protein